MISENCDIDEFVEKVKHKDILEVIALAVDETTAAERIFFRSHRHTHKDRLCSEQYARQLKQLINYLRFEIKPKRPESKAYRLYVANWGMVGPQPSHGPLIDTHTPTAASLSRNGS